MVVRTTYRALAVVSAALLSAQVWGYPEASRQTKTACAACHTNVAGGPDLTAAGTAFQKERKPPAKAGGSVYVGSKKCLSCHPAQHKSWSESRHAGAIGTLRNATPEQIAKFSKALGVKVKGNPSANDACVKCHVTGFQLTGGYPAPDSAKNADLAAVGCESCHGPGSKHVLASAAEKKKTIAGAVAARACMQCHVPATSPKFDYEMAKKMGVHPVGTSD